MAAKKTVRGAQEMKIVPDEQDVLSSYVVPNKQETGEGEIGQLAMDVFQTQKEVVVVAPLAGVKLEDISITLNAEAEPILEIKGERNSHFSVASGDYVAQECFWGAFARSIILPDAIDPNGVVASFKDGILIVRIPKVEKIKKRTVRISQ